MNRHNFSRITASFAIAALIICVPVFAESIAQSVRDSIDLCLEMLIPSLFCMMILSAFAVRTNIMSPLFRPLGFITRYVLRLDPQLTQVLIFGLIGGYPVGAKLISNLIAGGEITPESGRRMLCFCVNAGPAFLIGAIAIPLYGDIKIGFILFGSQLLAALTIAIVTGLGRCGKIEMMKKSAVKNPNYAKHLVTAVGDIIKSMSVICGFIIIFGAIITILKNTGIIFALTKLLSAAIPNSAAAAVTGFFEITAGVAVCKEIPGLASLLTVCAITSFGGLCVHAQIFSIMQNAGNSSLRMRDFYPARIIYTILSVIYCYWITSLSAVNAETFAFLPLPANARIFAVSPPVSFMLILLSLCFLTSIKKSTETHP
ncbi:MAG: hypothetical protein FWG69_05785 [Oscillospiraceae bacterium]|nr:hypothetical protein [Oscillospiraceae bacterium]